MTLDPEHIIERTQSVFVGRVSEINRLHEAFKYVKSGKGPHTLVLKGDSGVGKTRIVQEFFNLLSKQYDKQGNDGFWPDDLGRTNECLRINPEFPTYDNDSKMPFLWSGIRFSDPGRRNSGSGPEFAGWKKDLAILGVLFVASAKMEKGPLKIGLGEIKKTARHFLKNPKNLTEEAFSQLMELTGIPFISKLPSLFRALNKIFDQSNNIDRILEKKKAWRVSEAEIDLFRHVYDDLGSTNIPTVLVVDDAQWADSDFAIMVARLLDEAHTNTWPLLLIATCLPAPWYEAEAVVKQYGPLPGDPSWQEDWITQPNAGLLGVLVSKHAEVVEVECLKPVGEGPPALDEVLKAAFPGMHEAHRAILLEGAEGHPQHLHILIEEIASTQVWFEDNDLTKPLKPEVRFRDRRMPVEEALLDLSKTKLVDLIQHRLRKAEREVQAGISFGSHIGANFPAQLAQRLAGKYGSKVDERAIERAWRPHAFLERLGHPAAEHVYEFKARVYHAAANELLVSRFVSDIESLDLNLCFVLKELIENTSLWNSLDINIKQTVCRLVRERQCCDKIIDPRTFFIIEFQNFLNNSFLSREIPNIFERAKEIWHGPLDDLPSTDLLLICKSLTAAAALYASHIGNTSYLSEDFDNKCKKLLSDSLGMVCEIFDWAKNRLPMNDLDEIALLRDKMVVIANMYHRDYSYLGLLFETYNELISSYKRILESDLFKENKEYKNDFARILLQNSVLLYHHGNNFDAFQMASRGIELFDHLGDDAVERPVPGTLAALCELRLMIAEEIIRYVKSFEEIDESIKRNYDNFLERTADDVWVPPMSEAERRKLEGFREYLRSRPPKR